MADISSITVGTENYDVKDANARERVTDLEEWAIDAKDWIETAVDMFYPVGSILINMGTNPGTYLTGTTWVRTAVGKAIVGVDTDNDLMDTAEETFGQADAIIPEHTHPNLTQAATTVNTSTNGNHQHGYYGSSFEESGSGTQHYQVNTHGSVFYTFAAGNHYHSVTVPAHTHVISNPDGAENIVNKNYQPSMAFYIWKRTA